MNFLNDLRDFVAAPDCVVVDKYIELDCVMMVVERMFGHNFEDPVVKYLCYFPTLYPVYKKKNIYFTPYLNSYCD